MINQQGSTMGKKYNEFPSSGHRGLAKLTKTHRPF